MAVIFLFISTILPFTFIQLETFESVFIDMMWVHVQIRIFFTSGNAICYTFANHLTIRLYLRNLLWSALSLRLSNSETVINLFIFFSIWWRINRTPEHLLGLVSLEFQIANLIQFFIIFLRLLISHLSLRSAALCSFMITLQWFFVTICLILGFIFFTHIILLSHLLFFFHILFFHFCKVCRKLIII